MLAIRFHSLGGPDVLIEEEIGRPSPRADEMLVRVHAAGVNPVDAKMRSGRVRAALRPPLPKIAGFDFSGKIEEVGRDVKSYIEGDDVYGRVPFGPEGSYAELVTVGEDDVSKKPHTIDHVHAAAIPTAGLTAWQGLFDQDGKPTMGLQRGQTVLIHGASGGVGSFAVQLARWAGARVLATAGAEPHADHVRNMGADVVIDYRTQRFEEVARDVDGVLDLVGGETQLRSLAVLRPGGVLVTTVGLTAAEQGERRIRLVDLVAKTSSKVLAELAHLVDARLIRVPVSEALPLHQARKAHEEIETGHTQGKLVLELIR